MILKHFFFGGGTPNNKYINFCFLDLSYAIQYNYCEDTSWLLFLIIILWRGTPVNPEQFHHLLNWRSWNQSLNESQPKVSMTSFLCLKSVVV